MTLPQVMMGRKPQTAFSAPVEEDSEGMQLEAVDQAKLREQAQRIVDTQEEL